MSVHTLLATSHRYMKDDRVHIAQMLDAVEKIERFVVGTSKEDFLSNGL